MVLIVGGNNTYNVQYIFLFMNMNILELELTQFLLFHQNFEPGSSTSRRLVASRYPA